MSSILNNNKIIKTWAERGYFDDDDFSKFIYYWVSFNCWLYTKTNEVSDRKALKKLYKNQSLYSDFPILVEENNPLLEKLLKVGPIENNRISKSSETIKNIKEFKEVMNLLYEIRCNLFHGCKLDTDERDKEVLEASTPVLELIVKNICLR